MWRAPDDTAPVGDFGQAYGMDVAEGMIDYARTHMPGNVVLSVTNGVTLPVPDQAVSAVFSVIVFLHFDRVEYAESYFRECARVLKPGGSMMIQLPLYTWPPNTKAFMTSRLSAGLGAYMSLRRWKGVYYCFLLSRKKWIRSTLEERGFKRIEFSMFQMARGGAPYSQVFAQKA